MQSYHTDDHMIQSLDHHVTIPSYDKNISPSFHHIFIPSHDPIIIHHPIILPYHDTSQETPRWHPGDSQETARRHPGDPEGTQKAPRSHTSAARTHPGGTQEARHLDNRKGFWSKCNKTMLFYSKTFRKRLFWVGGSDVTLTKCAACKQKLGPRVRNGSTFGNAGPSSTPPELL